MKFFSTRASTRVMKNLPDDVLVDIFSRLPAELVHPCRKSSVPLQALLSSESFMDIHLSRAKQSWQFAQADVIEPYRFGAHKRELKFSVDLIDPCTGKIVRRKSYIHIGDLEESRPRFHTHGSCNGLLLFRNTFRGIVWNPITQEHKIVNKQELDDEIHGLYFDQKRSEYRILFSRIKDNAVQYFVYSLATNSWRLLKSLLYRPHQCTPPVITMDGKMHWRGVVPYECSSLVNSDDNYPLLSFHIDSQEWETVIIPRCLRYGLHNLREIEGGICLCGRNLVKGFQIWVPEDYDKGVWVEKYTIKLDNVLSNFPWGGKGLYDWAEESDIVKIGNDHLVVRSRNLYFYYNPKLNTWRKFAKLEAISEVVVHTNTVVSVSN